VISLTTASLLLIGPASGEALSKTPGTGLLLSAVTSLLSAVAAWSAVERAGSARRALGEGRRRQPGDHHSPSD
jgi:hypothetical protein